MTKPNPFLEAGRLKRAKARADKILKIVGRENSYWIKNESEGASVSIMYEGHRKWVLTDHFDSVKDALEYVHECLAYESDEALNELAF